MVLLILLWLAMSLLAGDGWRRGCACGAVGTGTLTPVDGFAAEASGAFIRLDRPDVSAVTVLLDVLVLGGVGGDSRFFSSSSNAFFKISMPSSVSVIGLRTYN